MVAGLRSIAMVQMLPPLPPENCQSAAVASLERAVGPYGSSDDSMNLADSMCEAVGEAGMCAEWEQRRLAGYSETAETAEAGGSKLLESTHLADSD